MIITGFTNVYAKAQTCDVETKVRLSRDASKVKVAYEVVTDNYLNKSINIKVYNVSNNIYVEVRNNHDDTKILVTYNQTEDGTYTFNTTDIDTIVNYTFIVRSIKYDCEDLRSLTLIKPKRNSLRNNQICQKPETIDYYYCREWINAEFSYSESQAINIIKKYIEKQKNTTTTLCRNCTMKEKYKVYNNDDFIAQYGRYIVMIITICIILDMIYIAIQLWQRRKINRV